VPGQARPPSENADSQRHVAVGLLLREPPYNLLFNKHRKSIFILSSSLLALRAHGHLWAAVDEVQNLDGALHD